jgi:hypothetical protein
MQAGPKGAQKPRGALLRTALLRPSSCGALWKRTAACCCALAAVTAGRPVREGGLFDPLEGGGEGASPALAAA